MKSKKKQTKNQVTIVWVKYKDHHWFDDGLTLDDIEMHNEKGGESVLKTDIGLLILEGKDKDGGEYIVISSHIEEKNIVEWTGIKYIDARPTTFDNTSRIMRCDIVQYKKWHLSSKFLSIVRENS